MDERFDEEFYRSQWQRVLPLGPHGIQPYVRTARSSGLPAGSSGLRRAVAMLAGLAWGVIAVGRWAASGMAKRPLLLESTPREQRQRASPRLAHEAARPAARQAQAPQRLPKAA